MSSAGSRQVKGKGNKAVGGAKQAVGKATGNRKLQAKGAVQKTKGKLQDATGRADRKLRRKGL
jgi:uncharacterized protein YjbJ (UPF0337 family)